MIAMAEAMFVEYPDRKEQVPQGEYVGKVVVSKRVQGCSRILLSDASSFMTEADLRMNGGHTAW